MARAEWRGVSVGILYNAEIRLARGPAQDALSEADTLNTVRAARAVLRGVGARAVDLGLGADPRPVLARLLRRAPDVVLNLCDAPLGDSSLEPHLPAFLELLGVPCTGSPPDALRLCRDKPAVKKVLLDAGVPTPEFRVVAPRERVPVWRAWPAIVKPVSEDASCGIDRHSVVDASRALRARVARIHRRYRQAALVERFVAGRELNVALVGGAAPRILPFGEIDFSGMPADRPHIVTFEAKWLPGRVEDRGTASVAAGPLPVRVRRAIAGHAAAAWRLTGCRDYARVDLRLDPRRGPFILEVNANPDLGPDAGLSRAWQRAGGDWAGLLLHVLGRARGRRRRG